MFEFPLGVLSKTNSQQENDVGNTALVGHRPQRISYFCKETVKTRVGLRGDLATHKPISLSLGQEKSPGGALT